MGKRILIVENRPSTLYALKPLCESFGYETQTARDSVAGFTLLQGQYAGVILDIYMPIMELEVLKQVRSIQPHLPVIVISATAELEREAMGAGASAFLVKPVAFDVIKTTLEGLIGPVP